MQQTNSFVGERIPYLAPVCEVYRLSSLQNLLVSGSAGVDSTLEEGADDLFTVI
ncbi:MAG: hypothetical protein HXN06_08310 [Porphyromonadaceae bacterium]|nr:hypothetical protein [Porphyromonadaceae bacterium]MBF1313096.1 hypothetical protein [Porphyromonadaceae bacterium]